jgi:hypothetical protein
MLALTRLLVPRMLATGWLVGATTAFRVGSGSVEMLARRGPALVWLGVKASPFAPNTTQAEATFRDEMIGLARETSELVWRECRRGVDDLDALTRTERRQRHSTGRRRRYNRVKL